MPSRNLTGTANKFLRVALTAAVGCFATMGSPRADMQFTFYNKVTPFSDSYEAEKAFGRALADAGCHATHLSCKYVALHNNGSFDCMGKTELCVNPEIDRSGKNACTPPYALIDHDIKYVFKGDFTFGARPNRILRAQSIVHVCKRPIGGSTEPDFLAKDRAAALPAQ